MSECSGKYWALFRGQVISILTAGTGIFATLLSANKPKSANYPVLLSFMNYALCSTYLLRPYLRSWWNEELAMDNKTKGDSRSSRSSNSNSNGNNNSNSNSNANAKRLSFLM